MKKISGIKMNWMKIIFVGVILVNIKRIFMDIGSDYEYAITQSYRMVRGDHMVAQMWEPHQTSAFLNAIFIKIYMALTGTTTGIALYLNIVGAGVKSGVVYIFYRTVRKYCDKNILFLMCAFFMAVNAKGFIVLDFSNMLDYFSVLLCCCLFMHFQRQISGENNSKVYVILAAVCFWMEVFSYPSALIMFPFILAILYRYSTAKRKSIALFSGICFIFGGIFFGFLILQTGWDRFWISMNYILMGDSTHQAGKFWQQIKSYFIDIGSIIILFCICAFLAFLIGKIFAAKKILLTKFMYVEIFIAVMLIYIFFQTLIDVTNDGFSITFRVIYTAVYVPFLVLAYKLKKYCNREEKLIFNMGAEISILSCMSVLLLTNWPLLATITHLVLGVMVSMVPIGKYLCAIMPKRRESRIYGILVLFLLVTVFRNIYVLVPGGRQHATILSVRQIIKDGPMKGMLSDYMGGHVRNSNLEDWKQYVQKGDKVLIVSDSVSSTIGYLYEDTEICVDSTISTPTYSDKLLSYWELNPWKEPNVVVLECWYGEPHVSEDTWIMKWIEDNFDSYSDGSYVRIYRREQ